MPSADDTFYNINRLHAVFALSALALLGVTVWMVIADHRREWKVYQRAFQDDVDPWLTQARIREQQNDEFLQTEHALLQSLAEARRAVPDRRRIDRFLAALQEAGHEAESLKIKAACEAHSEAPSAERRQALLARLDDAIAAARLEEENIGRRMRFRRAEFDEARSRYEAAVGDGLAPAGLQRLLQEAQAIAEDADRLAADFEQAALHVDRLTAIRAEITRKEDAVLQALAEHRKELNRLDRALARQRPNWGKRLLRLPIIDAFGRPLSIDQTWLPELTIDYNFRRVARLDRCATCHQGIDATAPGSASDPACPRQETLTVELPTPSDPPEAAAGDGPEASASWLRDIYGLSLAPRGIFEADAPTVGHVVPRSLAADAKLHMGDVILQINGEDVSGRAEAVRLLTHQVAWGEPFALQIRRGLPQPFSTHPRLDLFVGSQSPHPKETFGCTICHDGQGSATAFEFASHTPNDPAERRRWREEHDWFRNEHWPYPMLPRRFDESRCLKCHHDVTDLESSDRFPDSPAPKLLAGYHLIRQHGCFGCHEIKGVTATGERIGPDMRLEPNDLEACLELLADPALSDQQRSLARKVLEKPQDAEPRRRLVDSLREDGSDTGGDGATPLRGDRHRLISVLTHDDGFAGTMSKVGPSLRDRAARLEPRFIEAWVRDPHRFRPETRMPRLFGLWEHLDGESLDKAKRFEAIEVHCLTEYLVGASQPVDPAPQPPQVTEPPSAERGKRFFELRGCLACHKHEEFPEVQSTFGPDLTHLGSKYTTEAGRAWLVSWIRDPARHAPRTPMPDAILEPVPLDTEEEDRDSSEPDDADPRGSAEGEVENARLPVTDPAADIAAYLLASKGWEIPERELVSDFSADLVGHVRERDLDALAVMNLAAVFPATLAQEYVRNGIPASMADKVEGDARELVGEMTMAIKVRYVGRRAIRKRGCYGCHDIPGFEDAQPIGPALTDWGRKQESLLGFEQIHRFIAEEDAGSSDHAFYREALRAHRREGFIWQKLRAPRSFDYRKTETKGYNEWLAMGRFSLTDEEREAVVTFVLGLVADPPAQEYVYQPDHRRKAIVEGRKVLDKYGCAECHVLEMERWRFEYDPQWFEEPVELPDYEFVKPHFSEAELAASAETNRFGMGQATVVGRPRLGPSGEVLEDFDDDDNPLYFFTLWEPAAINGNVWPVGGAEVPISEPQITGKWPAWGGALARLLFPVVLEEAWSAGSTAADLEAWGWLPPPLVREGRMVEPAWLHKYLLDPHAIRPAVVLRMPKYRLSAEEAGKLVDYFGAASGAPFPYSTPPRGQTSLVGSADKETLPRLDAAMRLVTDRTTYCAKCHLIGDYTPGDQVRTSLAPDLEKAGPRLRPESLRRWLANPKSVLPYTGMPVNFPPEGPPMGQDLFQGSSLEQLEAVAELLGVYDAYVRSRISIRELIEARQSDPPSAEGPQDQ